MDHSEAAAMQAAERYVLGDMTVSEVEDFERHVFDCPQCSEELRALSLFQDNARAVFLDATADPVPVRVSREERSSGASPASLPATGRGAGWWRNIWASPWAAAPALATLVLGIFLGHAILWSPPAAQGVAAFPLYAASRGEETVVAPRSTAQFYTLYLDRTWEQEFPAYRAVVRTENGKEDIFSTAVDPPTPGGSIQVLISGHALAAGRHVLVILGVDGSGRETEAARYPFNLKFQ